MPKNTTGKWSVPPEIRALKPVGTLVKRGHDDQHYYVYEHANYKGEDGKWHTKNGRLIGYIQPGIGFLPREIPSPEGDSEPLEEMEGNLADEDLDLEERESIQGGEAGWKAGEAPKEGWQEETIVYEGEREKGERRALEGEAESLEYGPYACALSLAMPVYQELKRCFSADEADKLFILAVLATVNKVFSPALLANLYAQSSFLRWKGEGFLDEKGIKRELEALYEKRGEREAYQALQLKKSGSVLLLELQKRALPSELEEDPLWGPLPFYALSIEIRDGESQRPLAHLESPDPLLTLKDLEDLSRRYSLEGKLFLISQEGLFRPYGRKKIQEEETEKTKETEKTEETREIEKTGEIEKTEETGEIEKTEETGEIKKTRETEETGETEKKEEKGSLASRFLYRLESGWELSGADELKQRFLYRHEGHRTVIEYGVQEAGKDRILLYRDIERSLLETERLEELIQNGAGYLLEERAFKENLGLLVLRTNENSLSPRELFEIYLKGFQQPYDPIEGKREEKKRTGPEREGMDFLRLIASQIRYEIEKALQEKGEWEGAEELFIRARRVRLSCCGELSCQESLFLEELKKLGVILEPSFFPLES